MPDDDDVFLNVQPIKEGEAISFNDAIANEAGSEDSQRILTGSAGVDWVTNGGLPVGVCILLSSPQGSGKSTLLIETLRKISLPRPAGVLDMVMRAASSGLSTLYVNTEESTKQLGRRFKHLGKFPHKMLIAHEQDLDEIEMLMAKHRPKVAAVDSLHDLDGVTDSNDFQLSTGSAANVVHAAKRLKKMADEHQFTIFCVAHVTKDGDIAGSNTVQHALDMTLYLNGQKKLRDGREVIVGVERTLRCDGKNRFGETGRQARFQLLKDGLHDMGPWMNEAAPWESDMKAEVTT